MAARILRRAFDALASYGLAVVILLFLFLLTALGTWAQRTQSLFEVQRQYFESLIVMDRTFGFPIPLPGVYLLLALLTVNLICGGVIRIRKRAATVGVLIIHAGMLLMLAAGLVEYEASQKGYMQLFEGEHADEFRSYHEWEVTIGQTGATTEHIIPGERFISLAPDRAALFEAKDLPFRVAIGTVFKNARVLPARDHGPGDAAVVNGFFARAMPQEKEAEHDVASLYVTLTETQSGRQHHAILWGFSTAPWTPVIEGKRWAIDLHKKRWPVPFDIRLDDFRHELHPRTGMAKSFESDVTKTEQGASEQINISMNRPLRRHGYTFFQSGWGPQNAPPGARLFSVFAVVKNPADQWPLYSCIVIAVGLVLHFGRKLVLYVRAQGRT